MLKAAFEKMPQLQCLQKQEHSVLTIYLKSPSTKCDSTHWQPYKNLNMLIHAVQTETEPVSAYLLVIS